MSSVKKEFSDMKQYNAKLTEYTNALRERAGDNRLDYFSQLRKFPLEIIDKQKIFYIGDATEMLLPDFIDEIESFGVISPTNRKPIFHDRFVMPIMDIDGNVQNLVGYSKEADERYVYGTAKYYRRRETLYGLENLRLAYELGYAIVTEGITDSIMVRSLGYPNAFGMCGTHNSDFIMRQLNRCRYGILRIPDRDFAGQKAVKKWECNRHITLNTFVKYKDIDEMCRASEDNIEWVKSYIDACIQWLKQTEHRGLKSACESITMF